jgi:hypothetical protein
MIDEWSSTGVQVPKQISVAPRDVPLPMEEMAFLQLRAHDLEDSVDVDEAATSPSASLLAQMIVLNRILGDVNKVIKRAVESGMPVPDNEEVLRLDARLDEWERQIPFFMKDDRANMAHYAGQGLGRTFVAVYLGYYHFGQLLFYPYLHGAIEDEDGQTAAFSKRCEYHASKLCDIIYAALETPGCDALYNMVGHVLVVASTVQIHIMLFSPSDDEITAARRRLERNFHFLLRLRELWPTLDFCMMRLQAFHKACRTSMETSFRLDRWMLKFLSEFAKPVDEKPSLNDWAIGDIAVTPSSDFGVSATHLRQLMEA